VIYGSVCSGIEAASVAWEPLGWRASFLSEIEAFPRAVLSHHYPAVSLHGDFTTIQAEQYDAIDLLVGGTPCQSFSIAGLRGGLADDRGNLALEYLLLAKRLRPRWLVWENVPGVLSSNGGRDFGSILGGLGELGYGFAYRVLDAQYFGVAQRRRRVFVVGYLGDWRRAAAVLFERHSMSGHPAPRREAGQGAARSIRAQSQSSHREDSDNFVAQCLTTGTGQRYDAETETLIPTHGGGFDVIAFSSNMSVPDHQTDGTTPTLKLGGHGGGNPPAVAYTIHGTDGTTSVATETETASCLRARPPGAIENSTTTVAVSSTTCSITPFDTTQISSPHNYSNPQSGDPCHPLAAGAHPPAVAFGIEDGLAHCLRSGASKADKPDSTTYIATSAVRRLTPRECERLQGFPDDYTAIPWRKKGSEDCPDGPRYKALGNSMAVPVMRWIGERIAAVEAFNAP